MVSSLQASGDGAFGGVMLLACALAVLTSSSVAAPRADGGPVWEPTRTRFVTGRATSLTFWRMQGGRPVDAVLYEIWLSDVLIPAQHETETSQGLDEAGNPVRTVRQVLVKPAGHEVRVEGPYRSKVEVGALPPRGSGANCGAGGKACG